jgi:DNA-binding transcriptional ArsR family regulator
MSRRRDEVLGVVLDAGDWITAREISEQIGVHQATVSDHLRTLDLQGAIQMARFRNCYGWAALTVEAPSMKHRSSMSVEEYRKRQKEEGPKGFRATVTQAAEQLGWIVVHFPNAMMNPTGWPDLILLKNGRVVFAELKVGGNTLSTAQEEWRELLLAHEFEHYVWYPEDWGQIEEVLGNGGGNYGSARQ